MALYDPIADFYDLEYQDFRDDLPVYLEWAARTGGPVLDVGCGTGRVAFALAQAGFQVTGIDESAEMLARARRRILSDRLVASRVRLLDVPAQSFRDEHQYRLAILAINTFGHFLRRRDQSEVLHNLRRHLAPGGILIVDMTPPDLMALSQGAPSLFLHWEKYDPSKKRTVQKWLTYQVDQVAQIQHYTINYDSIEADGLVRRTSVTMPVRYTFRYEAELLLEEAGFSIKNLYGSYQLDSYDTTDERMIFVAGVAERPVS